MCVVRQMLESQLLEDLSILLRVDIPPAGWVLGFKALLTEKEHKWIVITDT